MGRCLESNSVRPRAGVHCWRGNRAGAGMRAGESASVLMLMALGWGLRQADGGSRGGWWGALWHASVIPVPSPSLLRGTGNTVMISPLKKNVLGVFS